MVFLAVLARPIFIVFLEPRWLAGVPYLQLLCLAGLMYPLHVVNLNVLKVKGRSDLFLYLEIFKKILTLVMLFISVRYGIWGLLVGQVATSFLAYLPNSYFTARLISYPPSEQIKDVCPALLSSASAGGVLLLINKIAIIKISMLILALQVLAGFVVYLLLSKILKVESQEMIWEICHASFCKKFCKN